MDRWKAILHELVEILQKDALEESESDEEIDFYNLDIVYEDLFWYAYIKNMFHIFCFLTEHIFCLYCSVVLKTNKCYQNIKMTYIYNIFQNIVL